MELISESKKIVQDFRDGKTGNFSNKQLVKCVNSLIALVELQQKELELTHGSYAEVKGNLYRSSQEARWVSREVIEPMQKLIYEKDTLIKELDAELQGIKEHSGNLLHERDSAWDEIQLKDILIESLRTACDDAEMRAADAIVERDELQIKAESLQAENKRMGNNEFNTHPMQVLELETRIFKLQDTVESQKAELPEWKRHYDSLLERKRRLEKYAPADEMAILDGDTNEK